MGDPVVASVVPHSTFVKTVREVRKVTNTTHGTFHRKPCHSISRKNPDFCPDSGFFRIFFHPKPGQFHVDSGNLNFMKICLELATQP